MAVDGEPVAGDAWFTVDPVVHLRESCNGWLIATLNTQMLMQMVTQARWASEPSVLCLPHIDHDNLPLFKVKGRPVIHLPEVMAMADDSLASLQSVLSRFLDPSQARECLDIAKRLPMIEMSFSLTAGDGNVTEIGSDSGVIEADFEQEYTLNVTLKRMTKTASSRAYAPKFSKPKEESWFLVLGMISSGELVTMKRIPPVKQTTNHALALKFPVLEGGCCITVYLMSDSYLGLDQQYSLVFEHCARVRMLGLF